MVENAPTLFEKLRSKSEQNQKHARKGIRYSAVVKALIVISTLVITALCFPMEFSGARSITIGSEWPDETLIAQFSFPIAKPDDQYRQEVQAARDQTLWTFTLDEEATDKAEKMIAIQLEPLATEGDFNVDSIPGVTFFPRSSLRAWQQKSPAARKRSLQRIRTRLLEFQSKAYKAGFVNIPVGSIRTPQIVVRVSTTKEMVFRTSQLIDTTLFRINAGEAMSRNLDSLETSVALTIATYLLFPNLVYSPELTKMAQRQSELSVPRNSGIVHKNEIIIEKGERVTGSVHHKLRSYFHSNLISNESASPALTFLGNLGHSGLIYSLILLFIYFIRKKIYYDNAKFVAISSCLIATAVITRLSVEIDAALPLEYLVAVPAFTMLLAILFDSRTAFYTTVTMTLLMAGVRASDFESAFAVLVASTFAAYTVRDLRSRTQVFKSMGSIFLGFVLTIAFIGLEHSTDIRIIGAQLLAAAINSVFSPMLMLGSLFIIERLFNIASDLRLLEYDNLNHPLLVELSDKAPGTYQHTLTVARLAESAARSVDANPILAKVGAYYHDIGKMAKAEYFVENQIDIGNKHDRLTPEKSAAIIRNHVEDGYELGLHYRLPRRILDFIYMHHGTMLIKYFYAAALERALDKNIIVNEDDFRYPGPRPSSKETAIVMLADTVEALSRTLESNSRDELDKVIGSIIKERLLEGQLDGSDLTLKDLSAIKDSFVKNLVGLGHQRIKYKDVPSSEEQPEEPAMEP